MDAANPFRQEDLPARVEALLGQLDRLRSELARVQLETATLTPWSWKRFFLGLLVLPFSVGLVVLVFAGR